MGIPGWFGMDRVPLQVQKTMTGIRDVFIRRPIMRHLKRAAAIVPAMIWLICSICPVYPSDAETNPSAEIGTPAAMDTGPVVHHAVSVLAHPDNQSIDVNDTITFLRPPETNTVYFLLHSNLLLKQRESIEGSPPPWQIDRIDGPISGALFNIESDDLKQEFSVPVSLWKITLSRQLFYSKPPLRLTIGFSGSIHHPIETLTQEYERSFSTTPGIIDSEGIVLSGSSAWIPWFGPDLFTYSLTVDLPEPWLSVSQGERTHLETVNNHGVSQWDCPYPMEEIYLIAAPFTEYNRFVSGVSVMAFLRQPDSALAAKYLDVTGQYLDLYTHLIGAYPFKKFALIENFWETGYGMPSFTLLGPTVIRLPFILHSSYPHELLHNWWGNGVYVDYEHGNWCEGLTAYLADHLIKEQRGQGAEYRRGTLQKFTDYVNKENDFPLSTFTARIHAPSEAVGYGKSLMMFHMLRRELGDEQFVEVLKLFYRGNRFRKASFSNICDTVESVTGVDWSDFFTQWIARTGAPELSLDDCRTIPASGRHVLEFTLHQRQDGPPYRLLVPLAVTMDGQPEAEWRSVMMTQKSQVFRVETTGDVVRLDIDPEFDVFRRLDRTEIPPALSQIFGADNVTIVLPESDSESRLAAYRDLADTWSADSPGRFTVVTDTGCKEFPRGSVWLFGRSNRFGLQMIEQLHDHGAVLTADTLTIDRSSLPLANHAFIIADRNPEQPDQPVVWLSADQPDSLQGLKRKLPHYGKYSYLVFEGPEPVNVLSGQWAPAGSPLTAFPQPISGETTPMAILPARPILADLPPAFSADDMMEHIRFLASPALKGRGTGSPELDVAAEYIARIFKSAGLLPGGTGDSWYQDWMEPSSETGLPLRLRNVIGIRPGNQPELKGQPVIVCAHYDHLGSHDQTGEIFPGADDNASGVALMCELAKRIADPLGRDIVFIAFTGEETGRLGSRHFVQTVSAFNPSDAIAAINLDSVGRYDGNTLLVLGSGSAREWPHLFMGCGHATGVKTRMVTEPLDSSDQQSFIDIGVPAVQLFSGPHRDFHTPNDTADKINPDGLEKAAALVREAILYLANRREPLTVIEVTTPAENPSGPGRSVGTGSMPDFTFDGMGVRLADVAPNSPADNAGLRAGDVLLRVGGADVADLRSYTDILRKYQPGDTVEVDYQRESARLTTRLTLGKKSYD